MGLGEKPVSVLVEQLLAHCQSLKNQPGKLLTAFLSIAAQRDGWPALGISTETRRTDPWKSILGGKGSSVSCASYIASREETREAIIYGYYLGTEALRIRLKAAVDAGIVWPSRLSSRAVRVEVDKACQKERGASLRDALWVTTTELGVRRP